MRHQTSSSDSTARQDVLATRIHQGNNPFVSTGKITHRDVKINDGRCAARPGVERRPCLRWSRH
jgi:hypothetical protein